MTWFHDLSISSKLMLAFAAVLLMTALTGGIALLRLGSLGDDVRELTTNWLPSIEAVATLNNDITDYRLAQYSLVQAHDQAELEQAVREQTSVTGKIEKDLQRYEPLISSAEERATYQDFLRSWKQYQTGNGSLLSLAQKFNAPDAHATMGGAYRQLFDKLSGQIDRLIEINHNGAEQQAGHSEATQLNTRLWMIGATLIALLLGMTLARLVARQITSGVMAAADSARAIASGDLTQPIPAGHRDEIGTLLAALHDMQSNLQQVVGSVRYGVDSVATASAQIAMGNQDLSSRTEQQASSLQETASSLEQMTTTVRNNADTARQASQLALSASAVAGQGGAVVSQVVSTMGNISASSRKIADIIGVIDGIAFQTNILALNAAVEAARAGEQGRGFAVVAGEVRILAQRSAQAAREIKTLINDSVEKVDTGSQLVDQAGVTMQNIVSQVQKVADLIGEINAATGEQSAGIGQINLAVSHLDQATQQNAALVEESAAAATSLKEQAVRLTEAVAVFRLDRHSHAALV
jgi:methyl-accepting chemotaxis protein